MRYHLLWLLLLISHCVAGETSSGYIKTSHGNVWYKIVGPQTDKSPILVIHGGPGGGSCGLDLLQQLSTDRQVIFYDQLGSGKSATQKDDALWQLDRYVDELDQVIKILNIKRAIIVSHSWGSAIAAKYLMSHHNDVNAVVFASPYISSPMWINDANYLLGALSPNATLQDYQKAYLQRYPSKPPYDMEMCKDSIWNDHIYKTMWGTSEFEVNGNLKDLDLYRQLNQINIAALVVIGQYDQVTLTTANRYARRLKRGKVVVIKDGAHMSMSDQPHMFIKTVKDFINSCCKK